MTLPRPCRSVTIQYTTEATPTSSIGTRASREIAQEFLNPDGNPRRLLERREGIQFLLERQLAAAGENAFQRPGHVST